MLVRKVAVITGGASGIGRCLVEKLLKEDFYVSVLDINGEELAKLKNENKQKLSNIDTHIIDVTNESHLNEIADGIVQKHGKIDCWINNAGVAGLGDFAKTTSEEFQRVIDINFLAVVYGTRAALKRMEDRGDGLIVNMASAAGHMPAPYMSAYCATKHAVVGFTRAIRAELNLKNLPVRTLLVSPGFVDTQIVAKGSELGFPEWMNWALAKPEAVAHEIMRGMKNGAEEIFPTLSGKLLLKMHRFFPKTTVSSSRLLLTKSLKDAILNRYTIR